MESICGAKCDECELFKNKKCKGCISKCKKCWIANYIDIGGKKEYDNFKKQLIDEINSLKVDGLPKITELNELNGSFVNLEYMLPNGKKVKFLNDNELYLGNQVICESTNEDGPTNCFGVIANMNFILVCEFSNIPEIIIYKRR